MPTSSSFTLLLVCASQLGLAVSTSHHLNDRRLGYNLFESHPAPKTFTKVEIPSDHQHVMTLKIALKQHNVDSIKKHLDLVSDPQSPSYGQHLTSAEIHKLSSPDAATFVEVRKWLLEHGFEEPALKWSHARDWITLENVPLTKAEDMLQTKYYYYQHQDGDTMIRTENYSLPSQLHSHIDLVQPTTMFGRLHGDRSTLTRLGRLATAKKQQISANEKSSSSQCTDPTAVTNRCLRELYKMQNYRPKSINKGNKIGVTGYIGERAFFQDLRKFMAQERPDYLSNNFTVISVNGGLNPQNNTPAESQKSVGLEGNLDIQTTMGITSPTPNIFYTTAGAPPFTPDEATASNNNEPYLDWLEYISAQADSVIPKVISTSYGDNEQTVPKSYARRVCGEFASLGARGVSLIFSSGDNGVGKGDTCFSNDARQSPKFTPTFPASCPYVTAVGATEDFYPEVAVSVDGPGGYSSGGGFSDYFKRPSYQSRDVSRYLGYLGGGYQGLYASNGRGYPDVSAQGAKFVIAWQGTFLTVGGTSASAPTFASVITLLNDYRLSIGRGPLGFLNPWLYQIGRQGFNDITQGSSAGCNTYGFPAAPGWDPVTGLGTPNFELLLQLSNN